MGKFFGTILILLGGYWLYQYLQNPVKDNVALLILAIVALGMGLYRFFSGPKKFYRNRPY